MLPGPLSLEERLRPLAIEDRSLLQRAANARVRLDECQSKASYHRVEIAVAVKQLRGRGVPAKTIAMALGVSKTSVVRSGPVPRVR